MERHEYQAGVRFTSGEALYEITEIINGYATLTMLKDYYGEVRNEKVLGWYIKPHPSHVIVGIDSRTPIERKIKEIKLRREKLGYRY